MNEHGGPRERDVAIVRLCECGCGGTPKVGRFLKGHYARSLSAEARSALGRQGRASQRTPSTEERFWSRVQKTETCWLWTGPTINTGYGTLRDKGRDALAHRVSYELNVGPIPEGLHLDHLCRVRTCVNPAHLEPVTNRENTYRGRSPFVVAHLAGRCLRGHEMSPATSYVQPSTGRARCRVCINEQDRERYRDDPLYRARVLADTAARKARRRAIA